MSGDNRLCWLDWYLSDLQGYPIQMEVLQDTIAIDDKLGRAKIRVTIDNVKVEDMIRKVVGYGFKLKRQNGNVYEFEPIKWAFWL